MSPLKEDQGGFYETRVLRRANRGPEVYFVCGGPAHCDDDYDGGGDCDYEDDDVGALSSVQCAKISVFTMRRMRLRNMLSFIAV